MHLWPLQRHLTSTSGAGGFLFSKTAPQAIREGGLRGGCYAVLLLGLFCPEDEVGVFGINLSVLVLKRIHIRIRIAFMQADLFVARGICRHGAVAAV